MPKDNRLLAYNHEAIQAAQALDGKRTEYRIEGVPGLVLRVSPTGAASYWFYYRHRLGGVWKLRKVSLGDAKAMRLAKVKERALELTQQTEAGLDPVGLGHVKRNAITFQELAEKRLEKDVRIASSTRAQYRDLLHGKVFPMIGAYPACEVTTDMVMGVLNKIGADRQADITKAAIGSTFRWAMKRNEVKHNPCLGLGQRAPVGVRTNVLQDDGIKALWAATNTNQECHLIQRLLLLTGQRRSEVLGIQPQELVRLDTDKPVWIIPGDTLDRGKIVEGRTKNGKEQRVPLSKQAVALLRAASLPFKTKRPTISHRMTALKLGATIHDLRRTAATWMGEQAIRPDVIDLVLNHAPQAQDVTRRHYNFATLEPLVRQALQSWADHVEALVSSSLIASGNVVASQSTRSSNVVPLRA